MAKKKVYRLSFIVYQFFRYTKREALRYTKNQGGIAQILVLLLLVAGIGLGTYLVQQRTNILPHACDGTESGCSAEDQGGGDNNGGDNSSSSTDNSQTNQNNTTSDGQSLGTQDDKTRKMFNTAYCKNADDNCDAAKQQWAKEHVVDVNTNGSGDDIRNCRNGDPEKGADGCNNPLSLNGKHWKDKDIPPEEKAAYLAKYCTGADAGTQCQSAKVHWMTDQDNKCKADGSCKSSGGDSSQALSEADKIAAQKKASDESKAAIDTTRSNLDAAGYKFNADDCAGKTSDECIAQNTATCEDDPGVEDHASCGKNMTVLSEIVEAQKAHDKAATLSGPSQIAAYDEAKLKDRTAQCDAVAAGVKGANCVLDVGDTQNIITLKIKDSSGTEKEVRVFVGRSSKQTSSDGGYLLILNYRDPACTADMNKSSDVCQLKRLTYDQAKPLLKDDVTSTNDDLPNITSFNQIRPNFTSSIVNLCNSSGRGCPAAAQASGTLPSPSATAQKPAFQSKCTQADKEFCKQEYDLNDCDYNPGFDGPLCIYTLEQKECTTQDKEYCTQQQLGSTCEVTEGRIKKCRYPTTIKECSPADIRNCENIGRPGCRLDSSREPRCLYSPGEKCNGVANSYCIRIGKSCVIENQISTCK